MQESARHSNLKPDLSNRKIPAELSLFLLIISLLLLLPFLSQAQAINLLAYNQVSGKSPSMEFEYTNLGERKVIPGAEFEFYSETEVDLDFEITISPAGKVKYVKPGKCPESLNAHRKGGINALYQSKFSPAQNAKDQKVKVKVHFRKIE